MRSGYFLPDVVAYNCNPDTGGRDRPLSWRPSRAVEEVLVCVFNLTGCSLLQFPDLCRFVVDLDIPFLSRVVWDILFYPHVSVFPII